MVLKLRIVCDNAAFEWPEPEIARILREAANKIEQDGAAGAFTLRDSNGNTVGELSIMNMRRGRS